MVKPILQHHINSLEEQLRKTKYWEDEHKLLREGYKTYQHHREVYLCMSATEWEELLSLLRGLQ